MSVIITLGKYMSLGDTVFNYWVIQKDLVKRSHFLKYLHGRVIICPFERWLREGYLWIGHRAVIYFILNRKIVHFIPHGYCFYNWCINSKIRGKYIDDDSTDVKPIFFTK